MSLAATPTLLFEGNEWDFDTIRHVHDACAAIA